MTEYKVNAVNLKSTDYSENDKILTLFSYEKGIITARAKGVKKAQAKLKYASEPFCFGEYLLCGGKAGEILCGCDYKELFYPLRENIKKYYAACAMAEYCMIFVQQNQPERELFKLLAGCINALCYSGAKTENVLLHFLLNALKCSGYDINYESCCKCGKKPQKSVSINFTEGGFVCAACGGGSINGGGIYNTMKFSAKTPLARLETINTPDESIIAALKYINAFIYEITGSKLKTIKEFANQM